MDVVVYAEAAVTTVDAVEAVITTVIVIDDLAIELISLFDAAYVLVTLRNTGNSLTAVAPDSILEGGKRTLAYA